MQPGNKKVCIIGAGPIGLVSARHLSECQNIKVTIFEANSEIGGLWVYNEKNVSDAKFDKEKESAYYKMNGYFHESLYPHLQTNIPYFFMSFKDLSHADVIEDLSSFMTIAQHKRYLEAYTDKFDIRRKIALNTLVKSVRLYDNLSPELQAQAPEKRKFVVTTVSSKANDLESNVQIHAFDYVLVCTGHNSKAHVPETKGIEKFGGKVMTIKDFREPNDDCFVGKRVLVVGASDSGIDVVLQLFANPYIRNQDVEKITVVGRETRRIQTSSDLEPIRKSGKLAAIEGEISEVVDRTNIKLSDGSEHQIDTIVFCTGYELNFPFLDLQNDKIIDLSPKMFRGKFISPLYKRFVSIREPNLFFMGLLDHSAIYAYCGELQAMLVRALIDGKCKLPSQDEMYKSYLGDIDDLVWKHGRSLASFFQMNPFKLDTPYLEDLKALLKGVYPQDLEKGQEFNVSLLAAYKKMIDFIGQADYLSYKSYDFHLCFDKNLRNSTSFI